MHMGAVFGFHSRLPFFGELQAIPTDHVKAGTPLVFGTNFEA